MNPNKTREIIIRIYDNVHSAIWAALLAFVLYFSAFVAPKVREAGAQAERQRILEIAAEHDFYCAKLKMGPGTQAHAQCILDLQAFRVKVQRRYADDTNF
jgi:lipoprotein NlpI